MTENALTIKDIDNLPYDQIAGEFGFVNEAEQSAASAPGFPRVTVNNKARNKEGNKVPDGTVKVYHPEHGLVYAEEAYLRIFQQRFFYQRYDENATFQDKDGNDQKGRYVNNSVFVKHPSEEALDEEGGVNCGKFKVDDWDNLSEDRKNWWRGAKRYRVVFGMLRVENGFVDGVKDPVSFSDLPVMFQISNRGTYKNFGDVMSQFYKTKKMPFKHECKFNFQLEQSGAISWYVVTPTITSEAVPFTDVDMETNRAFLTYVTNHNDNIRARSYEAKRYTNDVDSSVVDTDFIEVSEVLPE